MTGFAFASNIVIDALAGLDHAQQEIRRAAALDGAWISRMVWIDLLSKGRPIDLSGAEAFLAGFGVDEIDAETAARAAAFLVTRNITDFPADMPGIRVPYTF